MAVDLEYAVESSSGLQGLTSITYADSAAVGYQAQLSTDYRLSEAIGVRFGSIRITTTSLPATSIAFSYDAPIAAIGGSESGYAWTLVSGSLPDGLTLGPTGTLRTSLSGTPTEAGTFTFRVRVTDDDGNIDDQDFVLVIVGVSVHPETVPCDGGYEITLNFGNAEGDYYVSLGPLGTREDPRCQSGVLETYDSRGNVVAAARGAVIRFVAGRATIVTPPGPVGGPYALTLQRVSGDGEDQSTTDPLVTFVPHDFKSRTLSLRRSLTAWLSTGPRDPRNEEFPQ